MWKSSLLSVGLALASIVALPTSRADFSTGSDRLALQCKPQYATAPDTRDPITLINLSLSDRAPQIVHVARSGRSFEPRRSIYVH